jgi:hypothetical protein
MSFILINFLVWTIGLISAISFLLIFTTVNPFEANLVYLVLFFISLFLILTSIFTLLGYYIRETLNHKSGLSLMISSLRQATLISLYLVSIIIMLTTETFAFWQAVLLLAVMILLELYFR